MRYAFFIFLFFSGYCSCAQPDMLCKHDIFFVKTNQYKLLESANVSNQLEHENNNLSLLPQFALTTGQSLNNQHSFRNVLNSEITLGVSQTVYEGNRFGKVKKQLDIQRKLNELKIAQEKTQYLLDLFAAVIDYNSYKEQQKLYVKQLDRQTKDVKRIEHLFLSGKLAKLELDAATMKADVIKGYITSIESDIFEKSQEIFLRFSIPEEHIKNVTYDSILQCKSETLNELRHKEKNLLMELLYANYEVSNTLYYPMVSLSLSASPAKDGTLRELSTTKANINASLSINIPLSNFISYKHQQKKQSAELTSLQIEVEQRENEYVNKRKIAVMQLHSLKELIKFSRTSLVLRERETEYSFFRLQEGKETVMSYLDKLESRYLEEINIMKMESNIELHKAYVHLLG
ncbi:TolC family protein [Enterobacter ludwigii]|uniref:TolC family protein n=1 Tax=Enterobacter ludwigii TaxID=299767 RepID=UPI002FF79030